VVAGEIKMAAAAPVVVVVTMMVLAAVVGSASAAEDDGWKLRQGFYDQSCPRAEQIVKHYVEQHVPHAPSIAATVLRTHFHDCFVRVRAMPRRTVTAVIAAGVNVGCVLDSDRSACRDATRRCC
jgi:NaMN:DMB phosphoribosyltransferase